MKDFIQRGGRFLKGGGTIRKGGGYHQVTSISPFQDIYSDQISKFSPTMVDVRDIQLFLSSLLVKAIGWGVRVHFFMSSSD